MGRKDGHRLIENSVPEGWKRVRLGDVADPIMGQSPPGSTVVDWDGDPHEGRGLPFIQGNAEFGTQSPLPVKWCFRPLKRVQSGDVLLSVRAPVGEINRATCSISIGRGLAALRFTDIDPNFGWHMMNHSRRGFDRLTQGSTFEAIGRPVIIGLPILLPPLPEQRAIAAVLDSIDEATERTEAVIAATEQLRGSLLHELLTRGVPGWHTEWKDVPGLGTIPADWDVVRLGDVANVRNGTTPSRTKPEFWVGGDIPFVKTGRVNDIFIDEPDEFITNKAVTMAGAVTVPSGSVLIAMIGQGKTRGMAARLGFDAAINQNFAAVFGPQVDFDLEFFFAWARQNYSVIRGLGQGSNQDALNCALVEGMRVPKPSTSEQRSIAKILDCLDESKQRANEERAMLQALKASGADALLTGRVRTGGNTIGQRAGC